MDLQGVFDEVTALGATADHPLEVVGLGSGVVHVGLRADGEAVAKALVETYGLFVSVTVGRHAYPLPAVRARPRRREHAPTATTGSPHLELTAVLEPEDVHAGKNFRGIVLVRNLEATPVTLTTGEHLVALVIDSHGRVAGRRTGASVGIGMNHVIEPAQSTEIPFVGGTAGVADYATSPGAYDVVVIVPGHVGILVTPPVPITILP